MLLEIKDIVIQQAKAMSIFEIIAVITGIWSVWLAKKENILVFPVGIISVTIFIFIFLNVKLYADAGINLYYLLASIYGWYFWKQGGKTLSKADTSHTPIDRIFEPMYEKPQTEEAEISYQSVRQNLLYFLYAGMAWVILAFILDSVTDSDVAWWDAFINAVSVIAMLLLAKKKIENWIFWIIADAAAIPLCIYKGLFFTAFQFAIFTIIAIAGFLAWYNKLQMRYEAEQKV